MQTKAKSLKAIVTIGWITLLASSLPRPCSLADENPAVRQPQSAQSQTKNPLRDKGRINTATSRLLDQLRLEAQGPDRRRAIVAIHRLREYGSAGAMALTQLMVKPDQPMEIQFETFNSLAALGSEAVTPLLGLLGSAQESERALGWQVLNRIGPAAKSVAPTMAKLLRDPAIDAEARFSAAGLLGSMGPAAGDVFGPMLDVVEHDENDDLRVACLNAMCLIGRADQRHHPRLVQLMLKEDQSPQVRVGAASILVQQHNPPEVLLPALIGLAQTPDDWSVSIAATEALGKLGPAAADAVPILVRLLDHESSDVQMAAISACGAIGASARGAIPALVQRIHRGGAPEGLASATAALLKVTPDAADALIPGLGVDEETRGETLMALATIGPAARNAIPHLLKMLVDPSQSDFHFAIVRVLRNIGPDAVAAIPLLEAKLDDNTLVPELRGEAALALGSIQPTAAPRLFTALHDPEPAVRIAAAQALATQDIRGQLAIPVLLQELADSDSAEPAMEALVAIGPSAQPALQKLVLNEQADLTLREKACIVLGRIRGNVAPFLVQLLQHSEEVIASAAELALFEVVPQDAKSALFDAIRERERLAAERRAANPPTHVPDPADPVTERMLKLVADLSGGMGGGVGMAWGGGTGGSATTREFRLEEGTIGRAPSPGSAAPGSAAPGSAAPGSAAPEASEPAAARDAAARDAAAAAAKLEAMRQEFLMRERAAQPPETAAERDAAAAAAAQLEAMRQEEMRIQAAQAEAAAQASRGAREETGAPPPAAHDPPTFEPSGGSAPQPIDPAHGIRASGPMEATQPDQLRVIKVFYGTNRKPMESAIEHWLFARRGFVPAFVMGAATLLVCLIGLAQTRSKLAVALAVVGFIATVALAYPATQQASNSLRTISDRPGPVFGTEAGDQLELGMCEVSIPASHKPGEFESPQIWKFEFSQDPHKHIVLREVTSYREEKFHSELKRNLAEKGNNVLVFVHGYNVDFDNAARRTAQLACDLEFPGVPLFFSWPSQGNWYEYRQDEKQVELSVPLLKRFLLDVAHRSNASSIHLVAHSMGNRALTIALKEMEAITESRATTFNQVVLAAPDIDADVFRTRIAPAIVNKAKRVTLYASSNDLALMASRTFNGLDRRAGDTSNGMIVIPGIETIDVSLVDTSLLGHSYYGNSPTVLTDLKVLLQTSHSADERPFLEPKPSDQLRYWVFQHPAVARQSSLVR